MYFFIVSDVRHSSYDHLDFYSCMIYLRWHHLVFYWFIFHNKESYTFFFPTRIYATPSFSLHVNPSHPSFKMTQTTLVTCKKHSVDAVKVLASRILSTHRNHPNADIGVWSSPMPVWNLYIEQWWWWWWLLQYFWHIGHGYDHKDLNNYIYSQGW